ncbi:hypothetical protein [Roseibium sp. RKSG952]|uniref:hypothetical protein n=1 Tax=Roseibium sp. RKSG952 TaxID=2529384 RepID=UPI0012BB5D3A|nr:hypothetical protein [Roseibium sp. RKSG952]MTH97607.1 hypothetical protein [Roseibium sp. RKSG952]
MNDKTDITIEVFNHCAGTCTGCLLSVIERKSVSPVMMPPDFGTACDRLAEHGQTNGLNYRPVIVFGDVPWLPHQVLGRYFAAVRDAGLTMGLTMTLVEEDRLGTYKRGLESCLEHDPEAVFDITIDPIRMKRDEEYVKRILLACELAPELHLQMLLSEAILTRNGPAELANEMNDMLRGRAVSLGFTPAVSRMDGANFGYDVKTAADWAREFYEATGSGRRLLEAELNRFQGQGTFMDFMRQTFHLGPDLSVWAAGYTIFGDVILDARNGGTKLGDLREETLENITRGRTARRLSIMAAARMNASDFGCETCDYRTACEFNGIGAVRMNYKDFENRTGSCHGPIALRNAA